MLSKIITLVRNLRLLYLQLCCYKVPRHGCSADLDKMKTESSYMSRCPDSGHVIPGDPWTQTARTRVQENVEAHQLCCARSSDTLCGRFYTIFPEAGCSPAVTFGSGRFFICTWIIWITLHFLISKFTLDVGY